MKNGIKVVMLVETTTRKKDETCELNPKRAEAWVNAGWARYVDRQPTSRKSGNDVSEGGKK